MLEPEANQSLCPCTIFVLPSSVNNNEELQRSRQLENEVIDSKCVDTPPSIKITFWVLDVDDWWNQSHSDLRGDDADGVVNDMGWSVHVSLLQSDVGVAKHLQRIVLSAAVSMRSKNWFRMSHESPRIGILPPSAGLSRRSVCQSGC